MSFVLDQSDTYKWPVVHEVPVDGGRHEKRTFDVEFKRTTQSRIREIGELVEKGEITDIDLVCEVMIGWEGVTDPDGNAIKFSQKALSRFLEVPMLANSVSEAFFKSVAGKKRKN
tara:strand:+ start:308 stop:652 length:345 start_codon:yes stop_codon:yes gene_type:complete